MSLNSNAFITLAELKSFIPNIAQEDSSKDIIFEIYINAISNTIEKLIGRSILANDYIEKYQGTDSSDLILRHYPINSVSKVTYVFDGNEYFEVPSYYYDIEKKQGVLYKDDGWLKEGYSSGMSRKIDFPRRHIKVEYNAGFTEVPADLKLLCLRYISDKYAMDNSQGGILKQYQISDVSMTWRDEVKFSDDDTKIIRSYKGVKS